MLLVLAFFAATFEVREWIGAFGIGYWHTTHPYEDYAFPLAVIGILSLIVGICTLLYQPASIGEKRNASQNIA